ncbi:MAG TPA: sensor histidine kinase [Gammaproteobacteria bacterium]|nr:sensor histidine kinase [Gammaproteobacteria bacterium]
MDALARHADTRREQDTLFLPSFCDIRLVFAVVVIAELLAFVLVLAESRTDPWSKLGLVSLFMQWIALTSAAVLCLARPLLARLGNTAAALVSYLLLLLTTAIVSELGYRLGGMAVATGHPGFLFRNLGISAILSALLLRYLYVQHQWKQQIQAEAQARVEALQSRIRPHFLFNSMNSIAALTHSNARRAEQAVQDLADLFRVTLRRAAERVTLKEELEVARRYLRLEGLRLGDRLAVEWDIDTLPMHRKVPSLILQPLIENAVYHGIEPLAGGGVIRISGRAEGSRVVISVRNPRPQAGADGHREGNHIALENIRLRLQLAFGSRAGVALQESEDCFEATLYFPREKSR